MIGLQGNGVDSLKSQRVLSIALLVFAVLQVAAAGPLQPSQTGMSDLEVGIYKFCMIR